MSEFGDLIPEFVEESLEHLKNIEEDIIIIEQGNADSELINRVFRAVHSIKGGSSFLGLKNIEHLSHKMEDIFNLVRNKELDFTSEISSRILKSIDKLKEMLEDSEDSESYDIRENLAELMKCLERKPAKTAPPPPRPAAKDTEEPSTRVDKETFTELRKKGKKVYLIQFELKDESLGGKNPLDFFNEIEKTGDILVRNVDMELVLKDEKFTGEGIPLSILYATVLERDLVAHIFGVEEDTVKEIKPDSAMEEEVIEDARTKNLGVEVDSFLAQKQTDTHREEKAVPLARRPEEPDIEIEDTDLTVRDIKETKSKSDWQEEDVNPIEESEESETIEIEEDEEEGEDDTDIIKETNEFLTFWVGDEEYGIGITQVHEIVTLHEITPVPSAEEYTRGILNLRGDIIPVYDFRMRLKFDPKEYTNETVILIVMINTKKTGVIVDRVSEVIQLTRKEITDAPQMQQIPSNFIIGIGQKAGKFIILLKLREIFAIREAA